MKDLKDLLELPEKELISLIEKVMPLSGTYRQIDNSGDWSKGQIQVMVDEFINSIKWDRVQLLESVSAHDQSYEIQGESELGFKYSAIGIYSCDELVEIEDLEVF